MKHQIKPGELPWFQAYARMGAMKKGTRLEAQGRQFKLVHVYGFAPDDPHPPSVEVSVKGEGNHWKQHFIVRGEPLLCELQPRSPR